MCMGVKNTNRVVPLSSLMPGEKGRVVGIAGGRGVIRKLYEMGLVPSSKVEVLVSHMPGPVLIKVNGSRIAIGRGIAMKIMVRKLP